MEAWAQFFIRAGIPKEVASKYAKSFQTNRITKEMLTELDKSTLSELGVTAIGDQLCILRRIKAAKSALEAKEEEMEEEEPEEIEEPEISPVKKIKSRITAPEGYTLNLTGASTASELRRGKPPPDRNEIYHVKMPVGNTHRTRQILQKAEKMRQQGLAVRGTTGVRKGGRSVSPVDKSSLAARIHKKQSAEVSSSTDPRAGRHQISGPGATKIGRISTSSIKKTISNRPSLSSRLTSSGPSGSAPIRVHLSEENVVQQKTSRIEGRLQKVVSMPTKPRVRRDSSQEQRVVVEYEDIGEEYEEVVYEQDDDQSMYEEIDESDIVTVSEHPVHSRITYSGARSERPMTSRLSTSSRREHHHNSPPRRQNHHQRQEKSIHSRVSYHR